MLAKLKMQQIELDAEQLNYQYTFSKADNQSSYSRELSSQYYCIKNIYKKSNRSLAHLLQEGYEIAKGSLFQLMTAKNKRIQTRKALLGTQKMINDQKIALRFLQGDYND